MLITPNTKHPRNRRGKRKSNLMTHKDHKIGKFSGRSLPQVLYNNIPVRDVLALKAPEPLSRSSSVTPTPSLTSSWVSVVSKVSTDSWDVTS